MGARNKRGWEAGRAKTRPRGQATPRGRDKKYTRPPCNPPGDGETKPTVRLSPATKPPKELEDVSGKFLSLGAWMEPPQEILAGLFLK